MEELIKELNPLDYRCCKCLAVLLAFILVFCVSMAVYGSFGRCGSKCARCWDDEKDFIPELFNWNPDCIECESNEGLAISENGKTCVAECEVGNGKTLDTIKSASIKTLSVKT